MFLFWCLKTGSNRLFRIPTGKRGLISLILCTHWEKKKINVSNITSVHKEFLHFWAYKQSFSHSRTTSPVFWTQQKHCLNLYNLSRHSYLKCNCQCCVLTGCDILMKIILFAHLVPARFPKEKPLRLRTWKWLFQLNWCSRQCGMSKLSICEVQGLVRRQDQFAKPGITDRLNDPWLGCHVTLHYILQHSPAEQNLGKMTPAGDCRIFKVTSAGLSFPRSIPVAFRWHLLIMQRAATCFAITQD